MRLMSTSPNSNLKGTKPCIAETKEFPDKATGYPDSFEVHCSLHGKIFQYSVVNIRMFGAKEVQRRIDRAWLTHASKIQN